MKLETEADVGEWLAGAKALAVVSAWNALGLFDRLRAGPVARTGLPADPRALEVTIPVLAHVGLLAVDEERVGLTPRGERWLESGGLPSARNLQLLADLSRFVEVLRDGGPVPDETGARHATRGGTVPDDPSKTEQFLDMLYRLSDDAAESTLGWLASGLPQKGSVLDLGGGHGRYARAFADAGYEATLFDQPMVVELARKRHGDALRYVAGDFHTAPSFGGPYDLILLSNIVHGESAEDNASMLARAAKCLRPGGRVAVRDMFLDEHGTNPANAVFFGITMLFNTAAGVSPTVQHTRAWLEAAGLVDVHLATFETHQILTARKS